MLKWTTEDDTRDKSILQTLALEHKKKMAYLPKGKKQNKRLETKVQKIYNKTH